MEKSKKLIVFLFTWLVLIVLSCSNLPEKGGQVLDIKKISKRNPDITTVSRLWLRNILTSHIMVDSTERIIL
jgi:hypothetical protein